MKTKIKNLLVTLAALLALATPALVPVAVSAAKNTNCTNGTTASSVSDECVNSGLCAGSNLNLDDGNGMSSSCTDGDTSSLSTLAKNVVNILSIIVGIAAVIMIIIAGLRYITSGGESGNVSGAKNTLIYAIIGLVIVALAQFIVHFVLSNTKV